MCACVCRLSVCLCVSAGFSQSHRNSKSPLTISQLCFLCAFYYLCKYIHNSSGDGGDLNFLFQNSDTIHHSRRKAFIKFSQTSCFISFSFRSLSHQRIISPLRSFLPSITLQNPQWGRCESAPGNNSEAKK